MNNIKLLIVLVLFSIISILNLFNILNLNLTRIFNILIFLIFLLLEFLNNKRFKLKYLVVNLFTLLIFIYFTEFLFLNNLFDYFIILSILFLIIIFIKKEEDLKSYFIYIKKLKTTFLLFLFLIIWLIYSFIAIFWSKYKLEAIHKLQFIIYANIIFILFIYIKLTENMNKVSLSLFYLAIFLFLVSILEIFFPVQYSFSRLGKQGIFSIPNGTCWNINDFATFLYISSFFLIAYINIKIKKTIISSLLSIFSIVFFLFIIYKTGSRANLIGLIINLIISCIIFIIYLINLLIKKINNKSRKNMFLVIFFALFIILTILSLKIVEMKSNFFGKQIKILSNILRLSLNKQIKDIYSDTIRIRLILNGFIILKDTYFLGSGPGTSEILMKTYSNKYYYTKNITNLHNFWMELFVEYGIILFLLFVIFYFFLLVKLVKKIFSDNKEIKNVGLYILSFSSLIGFVVASISVSSLLTRPVVWIYLCYITFLTASNSKSFMEKRELINHETIN